MIRPIPWGKIGAVVFLAGGSFLAGRWSGSVTHSEGCTKQHIDQARFPSSDYRLPGDSWLEEDGEFSLPAQYFPRHRDLLYRLPPDHAGPSYKRSL